MQGSTGWRGIRLPLFLNVVGPTFISNALVSFAP